MRKTAKQEFVWRCHKCGQILSEDNCRPCADSQSGLSFMCISCESEMFNRLAKTEGRYIGLFHTCAALDIPVKPIVLDGIDFDSVDEPFMTYINALSESGQDIKRGKVLGFADGVTSLSNLFGNDLSHKDFAERIRREKEKIAKQVGTEEQREKFGVLPIYKGLAMSNELYDELDRLYSIRESAYKGQDLTSQQMATLIKVAKNDAIYDHLMRTGLAKLATDIQKSTSQLLADENMRPKDKKPVEELRLDALVLALEEAGLMENGDLLTYDELIEVMRDKFVKSKKYNYSLDVADQMILDVINSMRANADLPYIQDLPEEFAPVDEYGEFEPEETEREKENKRFLGITKVNILDDKKGEN